MTDLHAGLNGACDVQGTGSCSIVMSETAQDINGASLISPSTLVTTLNNSPTSVNFNAPASYVRITKDIRLGANASSTGGATTVTATVSVIDQFISQVPEPGFYGVLASGLSALLFFKRKRNAA